MNFLWLVSASVKSPEVVDDKKPLVSRVSGAFAAAGVLPGAWFRRVFRFRVAEQHGAKIGANLRTRLMLIALLAILPTIGATIYLQVSERRAASERIGPDNMRLVGLAADEYAGTLIGARRLLRTLSVTPLLATNDSAGCQAMMAAVLRSHPGYANLGAANPDGSVFCAAKPMQARLTPTISAQSWFTRVLATGRSSLSDPQISPTTGEPAILLGEPVIDEHHRIVHVLFATLDLGALERGVSPSMLPPRSTLTLFDSSGRVLARVPTEGKPGALQIDPLLVDHAHHDPRRPVYEHVGRDGVRRVYSTTSVGGFPGLFVTLGVEHAAAYAEVTRIVRRNLFVLVVSSLAALIAGLFGAQAFVVRPVMNLKRVMVRLAEGDLSARAHLNGSTWGLGELGDAVNVMAESLEAQSREREDADERVRTMEDRLRFALNAANVGIWEADIAVDRAYWSPECERMHGLAEGSFGSTLPAFMQCIHPDDRAEMQRAVEAASRSRSVAQFTYRTQWPDGTVRVLSTIARFVFEDDRPTRGAGIVLDVTERQQLEAQLRQAQKMEAVGQLAGGVAHDFNNLLTIILGNTELVAMNRVPDGASWRELDEVRMAAARAGELTRQLLAFSRKQTLALKPTDAGAVVDELAPMLRRLIGEDIEIQVSCDRRASLTTLMDRPQFERALMNVAVNARDAMPSGGSLTIDVQCRELFETEIVKHGIDLRSGPHVVIEVSDTGHGMSPDVLAHVFEPFFTTKEVGRGTGLGLSSVYGTIKQFGGHVAAASMPGLGTTITFYLPSNGANAQTPKRGLLSAAVRVKPRTILLVEDEAGVRELTECVLSSAGYRVLSARNGDAAVDLARSHAGPIDLVLTDVVMPGMAVGDMVAALRQRNPDVPVIMVSGYPQIDIARRGLAPQTLNLFHKPYRPAELLERVASVLV